MASRIQYRRDTASNWTSENPVLASGEPGYETDTGKEKIGDGSTAWTSLAYAGGGSTTLLGLTDVGADGTNGQVLTTNGSGAFTFTTVSGGAAGPDLTDINSIVSEVGSDLELTAKNDLKLYANAGTNADITVVGGTSTQIHQILLTSFKRNTITTKTSGTNGTQAIDANDGAFQVWVLGSGDLAFGSITNAANGDSGTVVVKQPASTDMGFQIDTGGSIQALNGGGSFFGGGTNSEARYFKFNWCYVDGVAIAENISGPLYN
jgi:hypothetical protein